MGMYFATKTKLHNLLFKGFDINNNEELIGTCIAIFFATVIFEALKLLKVYLELRLKENPLAAVQDLHSQYQSTSESHDEIVLLSSLRFPVTLQQIKTRRFLFHVLNTLSHMVNFMFGYMLMLCVMTFNVWLTIAVIVGSGVGYFFMGAMSQGLQIHAKQKQMSHMTRASQDRNPPASPAFAGYL